jgi:hypothetical protein
MDLYHLRQGLHVIASTWDYHGGAESRVSVRGNSVHFRVQATTLVNGPGHPGVLLSVIKFDF